MTGGAVTPVSKIGELEDVKNVWVTAGISLISHSVPEMQTTSGLVSDMLI